MNSGIIESQYPPFLGRFNLKPTDHLSGIMFFFFSFFLGGGLWNLSITLWLFPSEKLLLFPEFINIWLVLIIIAATGRVPATQDLEGN